MRFLCMLNLIIPCPGESGLEGYKKHLVGRRPVPKGKSRRFPVAHDRAKPVAAGSRPFKGVFQFHSNSEDQCISENIPRRCFIELGLRESFNRNEGAIESLNPSSSYQLFIRTGQP